MSRDILQLLRGLPGSKGGPNAFTARCPGHEDRENSLSVGVGKDGRILLKCHAGCGLSDILTPLDLNARDLYPANGKGKVVKKHIEKVYDYTDADGGLVFQVLRYVPKDFRQRRPDPDKRGGWLWNLKGIERPLYHLPEVIKAMAEDQTIYLVEGEKDADNLIALGFCVTTNAGGAAKWNKKDAATLAGCDVVILSDNDEPGIKAAWRRADSLPGSVVLSLPGLAPKGDISDWLAEGGTPERLVELVAQARENPAERPVETTGNTEGTEDRKNRLSQLANARRLRNRHGKDMRHHTALGWLVWDGRRWARNEKAAKRRAYTVGTAIRKEATSLDDPELAKAYFSAANKAESATGIAATLQIAAALRDIDADQTEFDTKPWLLNFANGTLDLKTGKLHTHERADLITRLCPHECTSKAKCPRWHQFLDEIFDGDKELIRWIRWLVGYSCTGSTHRHLFPIMHGTGRNGKGAFIRAISFSLGSDYAQTLNAEEIMSTRNPRNDTAKAALCGARFVPCQETEEGRRLNEALIKTLTGGDRIRARFLFKDEFEFSPSHKIWLATNHRPVVRDQQNGIWDRMRLIPFNRVFAEHEQDPHLDAKLAQEAPGILGWAIRGIVHEEPSVPACVRAATDDYRKESDTLADFLDECTVESECEKLLKRNLFEAFKKWSGGHGGDMKGFNKRISDRGILDKRTKDGYCWMGLQLRSPWCQNGSGVPE
jgi:putative DNA primase/helicase